MDEDFEMVEVLSHALGARELTSFFKEIEEDVVV